jgi:amidase
LGVIGYNVKQSGYKLKMAEWWSSTTSITKTGRVIDGLIGPSHPSAGYPHDFPCWWGYTSAWNILDYPAMKFPVKCFKVSLETDPKDSDYQPLENNPFNKMYCDMCKFYTYPFSLSKIL